MKTSNHLSSWILDKSTSYVSQTKKLKIKINGNTLAISLVEMLLAISIFTMTITSIVVVITYALESTMLAGNRARAVYLAEEGLEAVRNMRDADEDGIDNFVDGQHGITVASNEWIFSGLEDITGIFARQINISTVDENIKEITSTVTWQQNAQRTGTISLTKHLTNWVKETLGDWGETNEEGSLDFPGNDNALKVKAQGDYAYVIREGTTNFYTIDIATTGDPQIEGTLSLSGTPTNIDVLGDYAYVTSTSNSQELQIIDISTPNSPTLAGSFNASGWANGIAVDVVGDKAYIIRNITFYDEVYILDISDPTNPNTLGSMDFTSSGSEIVVVGDYAYVSASFIVPPFDFLALLYTIDVSDSSSPSTVDTYIVWTDLGGGTTIDGFEDTIVMGQKSPGEKLYVFSLNADPSNPSATSFYDANDDINDVTFSSIGYAFMATDEDTEEFQVIDINDQSNPIFVGSLDMDADLNGIDYHLAKDMVVVVSEMDTEEFLIIRPLE